MIQYKSSRRRGWEKFKKIRSRMLKDFGIKVAKEGGR